MGPYRLAESYIPGTIELRFRPWGMAAVGEGRFGKLAAVADLGAVRRPASRWDRLVRGVGTPSPRSVGDFRTSNESGLMFWPPRRDARPEPIVRPWAWL